MQGSSNEPVEQYNSVGGWLYLLCFALVLGTPARTLYNLFDTYKETAVYFSLFPGLKYIYFVDLFLSLTITVLSIRAGLALWNIKPGAVKTAKSYLLIFLGYTAIAVFLPFLAGLPSEANVAMIPLVIKGAVQSGIYFGIWYWYLSVSKRVKATYREVENFEEPTHIPYEPVKFNSENEV